jgi:murein DD-endopeptidase MepM/ murein hydrolase activator NlpD
MDNNRLTILLVSSKGSGTKSLSIDYRYIKITAGIIIGFILLSFISFAFSFNFYNKARSYAGEKKEALNLLVNQANLLNVMSSDKVVLQSRLVEIEEKLFDMQDLLDKKGINKELAIGGEYIPDDRWSLSYMDFMEKDINDLFQIMKNTPFGKPIKGSVNSGFGHRKDPFAKKYGFHSGIDFEANMRQPVVATADGVVDHSGWYKSYGKTIIIKHNNGYETLYGHLNTMKVKKGQKVRTGQLIGNAGSTGRSTGPHLHYEIVKNGKKVNPREYLTFK